MMHRRNLLAISLLVGAVADAHGASIGAAPVPPQLRMPQTPNGIRKGRTKMRLRGKAKAGPTLFASGDPLNRRSKARRRSSLRMVWPACFDAQVAKVHQLACPAPRRGASAAERS